MHVCRLPAIRRLLKLWNGPAALAVFIPMPRRHGGARACKERVLQYLRTTAAQLPPSWSDVPGTARLNVTLLYANKPASNMGGACDLSEMCGPSSCTIRTACACGREHSGVR